MQFYHMCMFNKYEVLQTLVTTGIPFPCAHYHHCGYLGHEDFFFLIVLLCHLFLISSASVRSIPFLSIYCAHLCMKYSLHISNFLEWISSLFHPIVFLYFFALTTAEGFLISPWYSLEPCIQMGIFFLFPFLFASLFFTAICKAFSDSHFAFLHLFFLGMTLIPVSCSVMNLHP